MKSKQPLWLTLFFVSGTLLIVAGLWTGEHLITISGAGIVILWIVIQWLRIWFDNDSGTKTKEPKGPRT